MTDSIIARMIYDFITSDLSIGKPLEFDLNLNLIKGDVLDSMAMVELILWLEEAFSLEIDPEVLTPENFATIGAIVNFVNVQSTNVASR